MIFFYLSISNLLKILIAYFILEKITNNDSLFLYIFSLISIVIISISLEYSIIVPFLLFSFIFLFNIYLQDNLSVYILKMVFSIFLVDIINICLLPIERQFQVSTSSFWYLETFSYIFLICFSLILKKGIYFILNLKLEVPISNMLLILFSIREIYLLSFFLKNDIIKLSKISIVLLLFGCIFFLIFLNKKNMKLYSHVKKQSTELEYIKTYSEAMYNHYQEITQFKHDYINILSILEIFIKNNDIQNLKKYYNSHILDTKSLVNKSYINLNILDRIQIIEIKSIITIKIIQAQSKNIAINLKIDEINLIPKINLINLVRILSIILDNSIEEAQCLAQGFIYIEVLDKHDYYNIIIKNNIRENIEPLHILKSQNFSTKGLNRGLGLNILDKLTKNETNIILKTEITNYLFIQELAIMKGV